MVQETTDDNRRERGFWIFLNTDTEQYEFVDVVSSFNWVGDNQGAWLDVAASRPSDTPGSPTPLDSPTYAVGLFHTHTPTYYRTAADCGDIRGREVGPSDADESYHSNALVDVPGFAADYIGVDGYASPGFGLWQPYMISHCGPSRRSTPQ
jgi:hypothetical protein